MKYSVRLTLTLCYSTLLAVILALFGGTLYKSVSKSLAKDVDDVLVTQSDGIAEAIYSFWEAQEHEEGVESSVGEEIRKGNFSKILTLWAKETEELETIRPICLLDNQGQRVLASASFNKLKLHLTENALEKAQKADTVFETFQTEDHHIRLITRPVIEGKDVLYFVQVASSLMQMDSSLKRLKLWLWTLIPATVILTSAMGWVLASVAFRPVVKMMRQVRSIHVDSLSRRLDVPDTRDELEQLAKTFNDLLSRLEKAFERLRQFSAAASHELRTPLTVLKGELQVSLRKPRQMQEYQQALTTNLETVNQMICMVEELLILARSEAGTGAVDWKLLEMGDLLKKTCGFWQRAFELKNVSLELTLNDRFCLYGEERLLERLISNLLDNALKYSLAGGKVRVACEKKNNEIILLIKDEGQGISAEELPFIFDLFFSGDHSKESKPQGFGLGLCRWIAEVHRGRIDVSSIQGKGTFVHVWLPEARSLSL